MPINFSDPYTLTAYGPTYGPMEGGNTIRIEGEGFVGDFTNCIPDIDDVSRDCAVCYFGSEGARVFATIESPTLAR